MNMIPKRYIKVNLPLTKQEYEDGNGEGVWVEVDEKTRQAYDENATGSGYSGILSNDCINYPGLKCGTVIPFEMRGDNRPVADYHGFLAGRERLTEEKRTAVIHKVAKVSKGCQAEGIRVKVIVHDGVVQDVLSSSPVDLEVIDIDKDYEDYDALVQYEEELWSNPLLQSQDFTVAYFS